MKSVLSVLFQNCREFPQNYAIEDIEGSLTYSQLESRIHSLLNWVQENNVEKESRVLVFLEKARDIAPVISGIFTAELVYVPLDESLDEERLDSIIHQVNPSLVLYWEQNKNKIENIFGPKKITIQRVESIWNSNIQKNDDIKNCLTISQEINTSNLCYLFFTSGTTSTPKCIQGNLDGITHFIGWQANEFSFDQSLRLGRFTTSVYDASLRELFLPMWVAGTLCDPPFISSHLNPNSMVSWIQEKQISVIHLVPSVFRLLFSTQTKMQNLKTIFLAGEVLYPSDVKSWYKIQDKNSQLVNLYGPTETVMTKLFYITTEADAEMDFIPIGKSLPGTSIKILSSSKEILSQDLEGEVAITVPFKLLGYLENSIEQSRVFRNDIIPGETLYLTGDYGIKRKDELVEFRGRKDFQVKINGIRIELDEIANTLRQMNDIKDLFVDTIQKETNPEVIVYYESEKQIIFETFRKFLNGKISVMPHHFFHIQTLPKLVNGKIDRMSLKGFFQKSNENKNSKPIDITSVNPLENRLVNLWESKLNKKGIGKNHSFFDLGGDSLRAVSLLAEIESDLGITIPMSHFLEKPTVEQCLSVLEGDLPEDRGPVVKLNQRSNGKTLWLVHPPGGFVFCYAELAHQLRESYSVYALQYSLFSGKDRFLNMDQLVDYYVSHILIHQREGAFILGGWSNGGIMAHAISNKLLQLGHKVSNLILLDSVYPYRLSFQTKDIKSLSLKSIIEYSTEAVAKDETKDNKIPTEICIYTLQVIAKLFFGMQLSKKDMEIKFNQELKSLSTILGKFKLKNHLSLKIGLKGLAILPRSMQIKSLIILIKLNKWENKTISSSWLKNFIQSFYDNTECICSYRPQKLNIPTHLILASNNNSFVQNSHESLAELSQEKLMVNKINGNHFSFLSGKSVKELAEVLQRI